MKVLLVNDNGHLVASMENLEQYDAGDPGDLFRLMDFMETLIAAAKGSPDGLPSAPSSERAMLPANG